ncbi:MAG: hypothetical protein HY549_13400 [Elusimicrobia bacterium]|nr:hypothetical protein [Elusimicrobiota bacterium]
MKRAPRRTDSKAKAGRKTKAERGRPMELDPNWHELEAQHDRIKHDWASLAAMLGVTRDRD